ncbi:hypothetical protein H2508_14730 [Parahaliea sp. F7430]|uniref:DUF5801 domain-containing protein n=1 Tax=Sediminihaliea albiluteola TaxID=2758564 RepID=A0A7W2YKR8_9GAMM|nr:hypothetical protein [Sediminihaliea albiluteola]
MAPSTVTGSLGTASDTETAASTLQASGGVGNYTYALQTGGNAVVSGTYGSIQINADGSFVYTLTSPVTGATGNDGSNIVSGAESFVYVVTDSLGNTATGTITINVADDVPTATDNVNSVAAGSYAAVSGNVITDDDGQGADVLGADGASVTAVSGTTVSGSGSTYDFVVEGSYGVLELNSDGSYQYTRNAGTPGNVSDVFSYTLTDADGDADSATLTINIGNAGVEVSIPKAGGDQTTVYEAGLDAGGSQGSLNTETTTGSFTYVATDQPATITINGIEVTGANQSIAGAFGTLTITSLTAGTVGYSYTLTTAIDHNDGIANSDSFDIVVRDADSDTVNGTLTIDIINDVPSVSESSIGLGALAVDESDLSVAASANFASAFDISYGADGEQSTEYSLLLNGSNIGSGLYAVDNSDTSTTDGDGYGQGAEILLSQSGNVVTGSVGGEVYFTISLDASSGELTFDQQKEIWHGDTSDVNDVETLTTNAAGDLQIRATVIDGDGDIASAEIDLGAGVFNIYDDGPIPGTPPSLSIDVPISVVDVKDLGASWSAVSPNYGISIYNNDSDGEINLRWGSSSSSRSGYDFELNTGAVNIDQEFALGTLTHLNYPVPTASATLTTVDLNVSFNVVIDGEETAHTTTIQLKHVETPNNTSPNSHPDNDDIITILNNGASVSQITVGDRTFNFRVSGFLDANGNKVEQIFTTEGARSSFSLWAEIESTDDLPEASGNVIADYGQDGPGFISWDNGSGSDVTSGQIQGQYGVLNVQNGSYTYQVDRSARDSLDEGEVYIDIFTWYQTDADGDKVATNLEITLNGVANTAAPIALDLDGNGVEYLSMQAGVVFVDEATGQAFNTAWVADGDGLLVIDANNSGTVDELREFVFTEWSDSAETDMEAVAEVFDTNQNQMLDPGDEAWSQFAVWHDANSNGITDEGELLSLGELGIDSIALNYNDDSEARTDADGDVIIHGQSQVNWSDGTVSLAEDTSFTLTVSDVLFDDDEITLPDIGDSSSSPVIDNSAINIVDASVPEVDEVAALELDLALNITKQNLDPGWQGE